MNGFASGPTSLESSPVSRRYAPGPVIGGAHVIQPLPEGTRWAVRYTHGADTVDVTGVVDDDGARLLADAMEARRSHLLTDAPPPDRSVVVFPEDRAPVTVPLTAVRAARQIPARPVLPASSAIKLQRLMAQGLPGVETNRLGGWLLRWGHGITGRANAVLPLGDPAGLPLAEALDVVEEWYRRRHQRTHVQIPHALSALDVSRTGHGTDLLEPAWRQPDLTGQTEGGTYQLDPHVEGLLLDRGYRRLPPVAVLVADVGRTRHLWDAGVASVPPNWQVTWYDASHDGVLMGDAEHVPAHFHDVMNASPARYVVAVDEMGVVARGRLSLDQPGWCGVYNVRVRADQRGQGRGATVMGLLLQEAAIHGAKYAYLQVMADNVPALRLYRSLGWQLHHGYSMWGGPRPEESAGEGCTQGGAC